MSAQPLAFVVVGTTIAVVAEPPQARDRLARLWEPFLVDGAVEAASTLELAAMDDAWCVRQDGTVVAWHPEWRPLVAELSATLNATAVQASPHVAVHAAVVAGPGGAVAVPAPSGTGKSTLAAACTRAGLGYVSDEALFLDAGSGDVVPYPKPMGLAPWSAERVGLPASADGAETLASAADLGGTPVTGPVPLRHVLRPVREAAATSLDPCPGVAAAGWLLENCFNHYLDPARALAVTARAARGARAWEIQYAGPEEAAAAIRDLVG